MHTPPESDLQNSAPPRSDLRWLLLFCSAMLLAGAVIWLGYPHAVRLYKDWRTHRTLAPFQEHLDKQQWAAAAAVLREARRLAPGDAAVVRASLDFIARRGQNSDPRGTIGLVQQLVQVGKATPADLALMGKMHLMLNEQTKAQKAYDRLTGADRQTREAQELLADILDFQGEHERAAAVRREALKDHLDEPGTLRQLAILDLQDSSSDRRNAMRSRLWDLARGAGPTRLVAVDLLAQTGTLTAPQAEELRGIVVAAKGDDAARLRVISAQMRISPQLRESLINEELQTWKKRPPAQTTPLIAWLAAEGEHRRILGLVPPALAAKFTDLLPFYVNALRHEEKWPELASYLTTGKIDPAFSKSQIFIWQTEARARLDGDPAPPRQMMERLMEEAGRGEDFPLTVKTAELAEHLGQWDLARRYYGFAAEKNALGRPSMLVKVYEMADHEHDGPGMLAACSELVALNPENLSALRQKLYLQALLGMELETSQPRMSQTGKPRSPKDTDQQLLTDALFAFRRGEMPAVREAVVKIADPTVLPVGHRAVYGGLLKVSGGDPAAVYRILEKLPPALLLPEEKKFAQRAW